MTLTIYRPAQGTPPARGCPGLRVCATTHQPAAPRLRVLFSRSDRHRGRIRALRAPHGRHIGQFHPDLEAKPPRTGPAQRQSVCLHLRRQAFVSVDGLLTYSDWHDVTWPAIPGQQTFTKLAVKQGDRRAKTVLWALLPHLRHTVSLMNCSRYL